jgi:SAM-dependent methyltransferase
VHPSSIENMAICYNEYLVDSFLVGRERIDVLDVGGADVNGSYRQIFADPRIRFVAADLDAAPGVDIVLADPYHVPVDDGAFDVVISGQTFEHCEFFWLAFREMARVLKGDGLIVLIAPSAPIPSRRWRSMRDAGSSIAGSTIAAPGTTWSASSRSTRRRRGASPRVLTTGRRPRRSRSPPRRTPAMGGRRPAHPKKR